MLSCNKPKLDGYFFRASWINNQLSISSFLSVLSLHAFKISLISSFLLFSAIPNIISVLTPKNVASGIICDISGKPILFSHFEIACGVTLIASANSSWVKFLFFLNSLIV